MQRKPEHYPKWLRDLLFDPEARLMSRFTNDPERNWRTLNEIRTRTYRIDAKDALIFDMIIEMERNSIDAEEKKEGIKSIFIDFHNKLDDLNDRLSKLEKKREI